MAKPINPNAVKEKLKTAPANSDAARKFMSLVDKFSYQQGTTQQQLGLTNFTFWAGAGFSKSWDPKAPVGDELFTLSPKIIDRMIDTFPLHRMFGLKSATKIKPKQLRQIVYQIDIYERYPDVRSRYIDEQNLRMFRSAIRAAVVSRYSEITRLNYFEDATRKFPMNEMTPAQADILKFFRHLFDRMDGSQPFVEGIRSHFITTNYDYVIETIIDNILGPDDSLFLNTYRGFIPLDFVNENNFVPIHDHWLVWHLIKINGGFEILRRDDNYILNYSHREAKEIMRDAPVLMLPSREQVYTDPYFRTIFPKTIRLLRETKVLVLVGYSLPKDDALIRFILRQFAEEAEDRRDKFVFYIDPKLNENNLHKIFPSDGNNTDLTVVSYEGGFDCFAAECIQKH